MAMHAGPATPTASIHRFVSGLLDMAGWSDLRGKKGAER